MDGVEIRIPEVLLRLQTLVYQAALYCFHSSSFQLLLQDTACHCQLSLEVVFMTYFGSWGF